MDPQSPSQLLVALIAGLGLSAACGFRVFIPPLIAGLAARAGYLELGEGFAWLGEPPALIALGAAACIEIGAYCIPWLDNVVDSAAIPAAMIAGTLLSASVLAGKLDPMLQWILSIVAGGGAAGVLSTATAFLRGGSTLSTGGAGNPLLSTAEAGGAASVSIMTILLPIPMLLVVLGLLAFGIKKCMRK